MMNDRVKKGLMLAGVLVLGVILGAALRGTAAPSPDKSAAARPAPGTDEDGDSQDEGQTDGGLGPTASAGGVGVGYEHSEQGAVAAAMSYATAAQSWLYLSEEDVTAAAESVVVPRERDRLVESLVDDIRMLQDELTSTSGTVWYVMSPLATSLESYGEDRAVVRVWTVRVLSADGVAVPQSGWQTITLDLEWDGDWLVADSSESPGPTPQLEAGLEPWAASYLDEKLYGFFRVGAL